MSGVFLGLREYIFLSLKELPLITSVGPLFLGLTQGNVNLIMLAIGVIFISTTVAGLTGALLNAPLEWLNPSGSFWRVAASDVSPLLPDAPVAGIVKRSAQTSVVPTYWMTMTVFFFSYLALNAFMLLTVPETKGMRSDPDNVENRKAQAIICLVLIGVIGLTVCGGKIYLSGGETVLGVIIAALAGGFSAWGWFTFLRQCGMGRLEDVFGIQARILSEGAVSDTPVVCI